MGGHTLGMKFCVGNGGMRCDAAAMKTRMSWARKVAVVAEMLAAMALLGLIFLPGKFPLRP